MHNQDECATKTTKKENKNMAAPEQIWNDNDLPSGDQNSITYRSDEDTIKYDRSESGGTAQQGLLAKPQSEGGEWELVGAGEKPGGVIKGSGGKGRVSILVRGYNIKVPRGDSTADAAVTVVNAQNLKDDDGLTIANNLEEGEDPGKLTVTPNSSAALTDTSVPGTVTIRGTNADGEEIEVTLTFADGVKTTAQTTTVAFQTVTEVTATGWKAGAVTIATEKVETIEPGYGVVGDTKTVGTKSLKGYAKAASSDDDGLGTITRVTPTHIYFNLP